MNTLFPGFVVKMLMLIYFQPHGKFKVAKGLVNACVHTCVQREDPLKGTTAIWF